MVSKIQALCADEIGYLRTLPTPAVQPAPGAADTMVASENRPDSASAALAMQALHPALSAPAPSTLPLRLVRQVSGMADVPFAPRAPRDYVILEDVVIKPVPRALSGSVILDRPWVTYDVETTALLDGAPRVLELGCVVTHIDGSRRAFTSLVQPGIDFAGSPSISFHRITPAHVSGAPSFAEVTAALAQFLAREAPDGYVLGGFNIQGFDNAVMQDELAIQNAPCPFGRQPELDLRTALRREAPHLCCAGVSLESAVKMFCVREQMLPYGAKSDAIDASDLLFGIADTFGTHDMRLTDWVKRYKHVKPSRFRFVTFDQDNWFDGTPGQRSETRSQ